MRGLDPRIHPSACANGGMDRRVEPGDDSLPANISVPPCLCGDLKSGTAEIAQLLDRLGNRLGFDRLTRPAPRESHVPERAAARVSVAQEIAPKPWPALRPRPLRLLERPEPIEATALLPDHPPVLFRCGATLHRVARAEGPERILLEWWHAAPDPADAIATPWRDYFRVEDTDGRRYWVYRETPVEGMARWFLHGQFG